MLITMNFTKNYWHPPGPAIKTLNITLRPKYHGTSDHISLFAKALDTNSQCMEIWHFQTQILIRGSPSLILYTVLNFFLNLFLFCYRSGKKEKTKINIFWIRRIKYLPNMKFVQIRQKVAPLGQKYHHLTFLLLPLHSVQSI